LKSACPGKDDKSCQVSCQDPRTANQCVVLQTQLVDGSPCGYGGTCSSGSCQSGSAWDTFTAWYTQNLQISIPVTVVAGLFVLMLMACCLRAAFRRSKERSRRLSAEPALARTRAERISSWPTGNGTPDSPSQGHGTSSRQMRQTGSGMAGIGTNRPPRDGFNGPPLSRPPALQPRHHHHRSRSSGNGYQQGWMDDSIYNGPGYRPQY